MPPKPANKEPTMTADDGCENCGMLDVPLQDGFCHGCTCLHCGEHDTMDEAGWCSPVLYSHATCKAGQPQPVGGA